MCSKRCSRRSSAVYLLDEDNHFRETPTSTAPLQALLDEIKDALADRLVALFAQHWPEEAAELADRPAIEQIIDETADRTRHGHQAAASPPDVGQSRPAPTCTRRRTPG